MESGRKVSYIIELDGIKYVLIVPPGLQKTISDIWKDCKRDIDAFEYTLLRMGCEIYLIGEILFEEEI